MNITMPVFLFLGFLFLLIIWSVKRGYKKWDEPLSEDEKNHYFTKLIFDITDEIKELKQEDDVRAFLEIGKEKKEEKKKEKQSLWKRYLKAIDDCYQKPFPNSKSSLYKATDYSKHSASIMAGFGLIGGGVGALLGSSSARATQLINGINDILRVWNTYLLNKIAKDGIPKKEKKRLTKEIGTRTNYLLNLKVLSITNQSDIKKAWKIILKDKMLTTGLLFKVIRKVYQILDKPE